MEDMDIVNMYWELIRDRMGQIPTDTLSVAATNKLSDVEIAVLYYGSIDYDVCRNHIPPNERTDVDNKTLENLFKRNDCYAVQRLYQGDLEALPTLLLTRDNKVKFVEVVDASEEPPTCVVEFYIRYRHVCQTRIFEVRRMKGADIL